MPWGIVEQALRLVNLLLEGQPPEVRRAQALAWFHMWWPLGKLFLRQEQREQIEGILAGLK